MLRARRLASVAVAACLTVAGLSACRSEPDVAAYLGSGARITVAEVQRIYDDARTKLQAQQAEAANGQAVPPVEMPITGPDIVAALVAKDVVTGLARDAGITLPPQLPLDDVGQSVQLPADAEYVKTYAEGRLLFFGLLDRATPAQVSEGDIRHVFDVYEAEGSLPAGTTLQQFQEGISQQGMQTLGRALAVKKQVEDQVRQSDLRVNPRYSDSEIDVFIELREGAPPRSLVSVPLTAADQAPVVDAR